MTELRGWSLPPGAPEVGTVEEVEARPGGGSLLWRRLERGEGRGLAEGLREAGSDLRDRPVREIARALGAVGRRFGAGGDPVRIEALDLLPPTAGISPAMAREVLDGMARDWTEDRLESLLRIEFPDPGVLDGFRPDPRTGGRRRVRALGPELGLHVCAGSVPGVSVSSMIRALLVKSPVLLKPGLGDVVLPLLFHRTLLEEDPGLGAAAAVLYWPGGEAGALDLLIPEFEQLVVYGGNETVRAIRSRLPPTIPLVAYHHRLSLGLLGRRALEDREAARRAAAEAARAVSLFDQRGCVSPHLFYVEEGGEVEVRDWARMLASALEGLAKDLPSGPLLPEEASELQQVRGAAEMGAAAGQGVDVHHGGEDPWTVVVDPDPRFQPSCLHRVVRINPVERLEEGLPSLREVSTFLQTAAVAGIGEDRLSTLTESLARVGVLRITSLRRAPWPPAWWHHDGEGPLRALVRWVDLEAEEERQGRGPGAGMP